MRSIAAAAALLSTVACSTGEVPPTDDGEDADPVAGRYQVATTYDLTTSDQAPGLVTDVLTPLSGLRDDPAGTVFEILESSDAGELLAFLPPDVRAELEREINDYVAEQIAAGGAAGDIITWADELASILTHFEVVTELELGRRDASGFADASHRLAAVRFELGGEVKEIPVSEAIGTLSTARDIECEISETRIDIDQHAFHLPLGELAVTGFNRLLTNTLGASDIGEALDLVIDCPALAASVDELCISSFCIGETEITNLCRSGLDAVAGEIEKGIASIDFAELRLSAGEATLEATKPDGLEGQVERFSRGRWQTEIDIDGLLIPVDASFEAARL